MSHILNFVLNEVQVRPWPVVAALCSGCNWPDSGKLGKDVRVDLPGGSLRIRWLAR